MKRWLAWLVALTLAVPCWAAAQEANDREWAEALVTSFLENPYVDEPLDGRAVSLTPLEEGRGWRAQVEAEKNHPSLMLLFDGNGRINQYRNGALQTLPDLPAEAWKGESLPFERMVVIDEMTHHLLNNRGYDEFGPYAVETADGRAVYCFQGNGYQAYLALGLEPSLKLYAFGDMTVPSVRYEPYLTLEEAQTIAKSLLEKEAGLTREQQAALFLQQSEFELSQGRWLDDNLPLPYWVMFFRISRTEEDYDEYAVFLDARTGERLEVLLPGETGMG